MPRRGTSGKREFRLRPRLAPAALITRLRSGSPLPRAENSQLAERIKERRRAQAPHAVPPCWSEHLRGPTERGRRSEGGAIRAVR